MTAGAKRRGPAATPSVAAGPRISSGGDARPAADSFAAALSGA